MHCSQLQVIADEKILDLPNFNSFEDDEKKNLNVTEKLQPSRSF